MSMRRYTFSLHWKMSLSAFVKKSHWMKNFPKNKESTICIWWIFCLWIFLSCLKILRKEWKISTEKENNTSNLFKNKLMSILKIRKNLYNISLILTCIISFLKHLTYFRKMTAFISTTFHQFFKHLKKFFATMKLNSATLLLAFLLQLLTALLLTLKFCLKLFNRIGKKKKNYFFKF